MQNSTDDENAADSPGENELHIAIPILYFYIYFKIFIFVFIVTSIRSAVKNVNVKILY